ncbi:MAG TPA: 4Fe-4S dicluster domain-containing protein [Polyangiaceae bacterium]|nr:4Fe-4S dicluster domain-containing protein [Polyangiaceae bacterium]
MTTSIPGNPADGASGPALAAERDEDDRLVPASTLTRRRFVESIGVGIAALAANACARQPRERIVPYVQRSAEVVPGVAQFYATSTARDGYGFGLLAKSHEGRPTKLEGHPDHPASQGATGLREQAEIFRLYDPDRARAYMMRKVPSSWETFALAFAPGGHQPWMQRRGQGLALVLEPSASPLRRNLLDRLRDRYPDLSVAYHTTTGIAQRWNGAKEALGTPADVHYRLANADVLLSLDAELCGSEPMAIPWARQFAERRKAVAPGTPPPRLYVVESSLTLAGVAADHRLAVPASHVGAIAAALFAAVAASTGQAAAAPLATAARRFLDASPHRRFVEAAARDLVRHPGRCVVMVGERQPAAVHVLGHALNWLLEAFGATAEFTASSLPDAGTAAYDLAGVLSALDADHVDTLMTLGPNPAYTLPADAEWERRSLRAHERVHLSLYENETSRNATWFLPAAHFLEQWGDARAYDGTISFTQPLIDPLYGGKSVEEVLSVLAGNPEGGRALLEASWRRPPAGVAPLQNFDDALRRGVLPGTSAPRITPALDMGAVSRALGAIQAPSSALELDVLLDPRLGDGDGANVAWLQELAEPVTKVVWGNVALVGPRTAKRLEIRDRDVVAIEHEGRRVVLPALVERGHAEGAVTVWLGHGRRAGGRVARGVGTDVAPLRTSESPWFVRGVTVVKTGARDGVVKTQTETELHDRPILLRKTMEQWKQDPDFARVRNEDPPTILPDRLGAGPQWGMAIDLNACVGCSSCMMACAVENNLSTVGKQNVALFREMYWIRVDIYHRGSDENPAFDFQPMLCQHCEKAPCEYVCPVNATVHSPDGLNEMVYNRCVGTRFCSNNCPYKVRRFNFFNYNNALPETVRMGKNPEVTVRGRGVMEKCTYCVQRIRRTEIEARVADRDLKDGDVVTACQQACPTQAIVFGDLADRSSRVARLFENARIYAVLGDIGTRPRTRYLARVTDPNPELET